MPDVLVSRSLFQPNRVDTPSATKIAALEAGLEPAPKPPERELVAQAIRLQLLSVQIMDGLQGVWGTGIGAATGVYLITTVVDGFAGEPIVFQGKTYRGIENGAMLPLGPDHEPRAVMNLYLREGELPRALSFSLTVFRSNADIREIAGVLSAVRGDDRYKRLAEIVTGAVTGANPAFGIIWQAAEEIVGLTGEYLKAKPDDQLCYYQANFTNRFDNLGVGRHPDDAPTMQVDKVRFAYRIDAG